MVHVGWTLKVAQTELNETEYQLLARYAEEHKLTVKEALRMAAPIFKNIERASKPGRKSQWSIDHDKILYSKP
jgi:hypothetical protein